LQSLPGTAAEFKTPFRVSREVADARFPQRKVKHSAINRTAGSFEIITRRLDCGNVIDES
jgi:hypothetical protein